MPKGQIGIVREKGVFTAARFYDLNSGQSCQLWNKCLAGAPGPFGNSALDSIEVTNTIIATISRQSNPALALGAEVDLFDMLGGRSVDRIDGDPHDLALDASGQNLVVRPHLLLARYDQAAWIPGGPFRVVERGHAQGHGLQLERGPGGRLWALAAITRRARPTPA